MEKQFCIYSISLKLKKLGFDEECFGYFDEDANFCTFEYYDVERQNSTIQSEYAGIKQCTAPLWQQAIEFLLKGLHQKYPYIHIMYVNPNEYSILMEQPKDTFTGRDYVDYGVNSIEELVLKMIELYNIKIL